MKYIERNILFRFFRACTEMEQSMLLCCLFSTGLLACRVVYTGSIMFAFLAWNLFLAWIPYAFSKWMKDHQRYTRNWKVLSLAFIWVLFIPNSFYIITDLFHLDMNAGIPQWYDLALLLSFAWSGLLFGMVSVRHMEQVFENHLGRKLGDLFILPVMALNGLGIYTGRYLRFNSWDVLSNPFSLVRDMIDLFIHPLHNRFDWSMIVCYSVLLTLMYRAVKKMGRVL